MTFPLNSMVGREFVPNEDMGEWIVHLDAPEGTSLEGSTEIAFKLLKAISGIEGVAHIEPSIGVSGGWRVHAHSSDLSGGAARPAQEHAGRDHRRDARRPRGVPRYRPSITARNALGSGEGTGGFAISANILGPDLNADRRVFEAGARRGAEDPSLTDARSTSACRIPRFTSRSIASAPPISACGWRPSATRCGSRCPATTDLVLQGGGRAVSGQDARARRAAPRHRGDRPADSAVGHRSRAHRQHRQLERGLGPTTLARSNRQFTVMLIADVAQAMRSTKRRATSARCSPA